MNDSDVYTESDFQDMRKAVQAIIESEGAEDVSENYDDVSRDSAASEPGQNKGSVFANLDLGDHIARRYLTGDLPELEWVFTQFVLTRNVMMLIGPPGVGKSMLCLQMASAIAAGRGMGTILEPGVQGKVVYFAGEEDERIIPRRLRRVFNHFYGSQQSYAPLDDTHHYVQNFNRTEAEKDFESNVIVTPLSGNDVRLLEQRRGEPATTNEIYDDLLTLCKGVPDLKLIIIDPLARFYGLEENDNSDATVFMTALERLAQETGAAVIAVHHTSKDGSSGYKNDNSGKAYLNALRQNSSRGASGFVGAARAQMNIVGLSKTEAAQLFEASDDPDNSYLAIGFPKCSYGPPMDHVFMKRLKGGVLVPVIPKKETKAKQVKDQLVELVIKQVREDEESEKKPLTIDSFCRIYSSEWKNEHEGVSISSVKTALETAVHDNRLHLVKIRNLGNRQWCHYLSTSPELHSAEQTAPEPDDSDDAARRTPQEEAENSLAASQALAEEDSHAARKPRRKKRLRDVGTRANSDAARRKNSPPKGGRETLAASLPSSPEEANP